MILPKHDSGSAGRINLLTSQVNATRDSANLIATASSPEVGMMIRKNHSLTKENKNLIESKAELQRQLSEVQASHVKRVHMDLLAKDNRALRRYIEELQSPDMQCREYSQILRELKDAKVALALLSLENERYKDELSRLKKKVQPAK